MSIEEDFLRAIIAEPDNDDHRLVYADWLEENGHTDRSRFIRMQIELERLPKSDPRRRQLDQAANDIRWKHAGEWPGDVFNDNDELGHCTYERGFICCVSYEKASDFLIDPNPLLEREPITCLDLTVTPDDITPLANEPRLARFESIWLHQAEDETRKKQKPVVPKFDEILLSPHLANLRKLGLCAADEARPDRGHATLKVLATRPEFAQLEELRFDEYPLDVAGATILAESKTLRNVRQLEIWGTTLKVEPLRILAASPMMESVKTLEIFNAVKPRSPVAWVDALVSGLFPNLRSLNLSSCDLGDAAIERLAQATQLQGLRTLVLNSNLLTSAAVNSLVNSPLLESLEILNLSENELDDDGGVALAESPRLGKLKELWIGSNQLGIRSLEALIHSPALRDIEQLGMENSPLGDRGALLLAAANWPRLHTLDLSECQISDIGANKLGKSRTLPARLAELQLHLNPIGSETVERLGERFGTCEFDFEIHEDDDEEFDEEDWDNEES